TSIAAWTKQKEDKVTQYKSVVYSSSSYSPDAAEKEGNQKTTRFTMILVFSRQGKINVTQLTALIMLIFYFDVSLLHSPTRRIAMDCEFVGVGYEARVSIVNQFGHVLLDTYVRPEERVVDYRTKFSGIRPRDLRKNGPARPFHEVHKEVADLIKNRVLVGHSILKDLHVLRLSHPRRFIRDTSRYRPFRDLFSGRIPSLKALTQKVLSVTVQDGEHDSVEDARATMRLYTSVKRVWESSKKNRSYSVLL
ncbi:unnamed protein product, partial [Trichobilharzia regenti]